MFYDYNKEMAIGLNKKYTVSRNLEYFLRTILFSEVVPNYKMQFYNKKGNIIKVKITGFVEDIVLNVTQAQDQLQDVILNKKEKLFLDAK